MREYGVRTCSEECGMLVVAPSYDMRYRGVMWTYMENPVGAELRYCPFCGTRVGVERRANGSISWREAMAPRAALEWAVHKIDGCVYRDGRECAVVESGEENEDCFDGICFEHRMQAALKAAEEATQSE